MQSVFDSFCRCFGTPVNSADMEVITDSAAADGVHGAEGRKIVASSPDMKRRTRSLKLQDEQWDALFDCNATGMIHSKREGGESITVEQARALAKAKLEANGSKKPQKRKRQTAEDIFRSKKTTATREEPQANPF